MRRLLIATLLTTCALAQDTLEVVVTATQLEETIHELPHAVSRLDREQLENVGQLPDALSRLPSVSLQKTGPGQASPYIRGLTGFHNVYLIDGIRLNNSVFRSGPNQYFSTIDALTIERLEVLRGPASVLYGSDALGGVLQGISRLPPYADEGWEVGGEAYARYSSSDHSTISRLAVRFASEEFAARAGSSYKDFKDLQAGDHQGRLENTAFSEFDQDVRLSYRFAPGVEARFGFDRVRQANVPRTHSTIDSQSYRGTEIGSRQRRDLDQLRELVYAQLSLTPEQGMLAAADFSLSYQRQAELQKQQRGSSDTRQGFEVHTLGVLARFELEPAEWLRIALGSDYYHDEVDSSRHNYDLSSGDFFTVGRGPVADDSSYDLFGTYLQLDLRTWRWLRLIVGTRFTLAHLNANQVDFDTRDSFVLDSEDETYTSIVGSFRARIEPIEQLAFILGVSQGFRAPNLDDVSAFNEVRSSSVDLPSSDLEPEETVTFEAGLRWNTRYTRGSAFYFYTLLDDFIGRVPTGNTNQGLEEFRKENFSDGFIHGVEIDGQVTLWEPWGLYLRGGFAWLEGSADASVGGVEQDDGISRLQPAKGYAALRWEWEQSRYWAELRGDFVRQQGRLSARDRGDDERIPARGTPGYSLWSISAGARPLEFLSLGVELSNLSDHDYRVHGSGQNGAGFGVSVWARLEF